MKAIIIDETENRSLLWKEVSPLVPGDDEVLIRSKATALNRADLLQRKGMYPPPPGASDVLGLEVAGVIETCGKNVTGWKPGDRVCALLPGGGYAEFATCHQDMLLPIPEALSFEEAASLPEAMYTAYLNIFMLGKASRDESVLIHAGASGVGSMGIQICHALGISTFATTSTAKVEFVRDLGATAVWDRKQDNFWEQVRKESSNIGVIFDPVGGNYLQHNLKVINKDGRIVLIGLLAGRKTEINLGLLLMKRVELIGSTLRSRDLEYKINITKAIKKDCWPFVESGKIRPLIDCAFPIQKAEKAHDYMSTDQSMGKIILSF